VAIDYDTIRDVIAATRHCAIATSSPTGEPWLSTVFFNYTPDFDLVWESARDARHSQLLRENPRVAIYIGRHDQITGALFGDAEASEVSAGDIPAALGTWLHGPHQREDPQRTPDDYAFGKPLGLYRAHLRELYVISHTKLEGYTVEQREKVDLGRLRGSDRS